MNRLLIKTLSVLFLTSQLATAATVAPEQSSALGLQLWSLREEMKTSESAALDDAQRFGFTHLEMAGTGNLTPAAFRELLNDRSIQAVSGHFAYDRLKKDLPGILAEAKILGLEFIICPSLPRSVKVWDEAAANAIAEEFSTWGRAAQATGLKFGFHNHGVEFTPLADAPDRTVFDVLMARTDPALVCFEMDVFFITQVGRDPVALLAAHPGRWQLMHLKDMRAGAVTGVLVGRAPPTDNVPVGAGQIDWPKLLPAAQAAGVRYFFIEDASLAPTQSIPVSLRYLRDFKF